MNPWAVSPAWQNFSSLYREAITATEARTGMERSHHLTASLYFGIAALQAFLNQKMRAHLDGKMSEIEILNVLRKETIIKHLKQWPVQLLGKELLLSPGTMDLITFFKDVRDDLTHLKTHGHDIYAALEKVDPSSVIDSVAEYIVRYSEAEGVHAPYWVFGWNYLNPRPDEYDILLVNEQQFSSSLQALGLQTVGLDAWRSPRLGNFDGYVGIKNGLAAIGHCQPKAGLFPFMPILCSRWWTPEHQRSCGSVTEQAVQKARKLAARR